MSEQLTAPRFAAALEGLAHRVVAHPDGAAIEVEQAALHDVLRALRDRAGFAMCTFVTAIDHYPREPRFQLHHQLLSLEHRDRVRVQCTLSGASAPTCSDLWPGANWMERECFDMFGIHFTGHPDLRRLLMPEGYEHHPLRKEFPHHGIEPDKLYRDWDRKRREGWTETP
ncbi:MAG: NADH-quinone oxidoreductase subunit C [Planctomycetes bacterium]|nr:NADH-quinone oxidoreductase subunit C [Planctomycetota bacterium]